MDQNSIILEPLLEKGTLKPNALEILQVAASRGKVSTYELASIVSLGATNDHSKLVEAVTWFKDFLPNNRISLVTSKAEIEYRKKLFSLKKHDPGFKLYKVSKKTRSILDELNEGEIVNFDYSDISEYAENDSVSWLMRKMNHYPLLSAGETLKLAKQVVLNGDVKARNRLVQHNLRLVIKIAKQYLWSGLGFEDLIQEGVIGLMIAVQKFDFRKKNQLSTYAYWWIRAKILRAIQDKGKMIRFPVSIQELRNKIVKHSEILADQLGRLPSVGEIAQKLRKTENEIETTLELCRLSIVSLDEDLYSKKDKDGNQLNRQSVVGDTNVVKPSFRMEAHNELEESLGKIRRLFSLVDSIRHKIGSDRNQLIFKKFYGLDNSFQSRTLETIGIEFGITHERVRQIIEKLWLYLEAAGAGLNDSSLRNEIVRICKLETLTGESAQL